VAGDSAVASETSSETSSADVTIDTPEEAVEVSSPVCYAGEFETNNAAGDAISGAGSDAIAPVTAQEDAPAVIAAEEKKPEAPVAPALPSGHFRATPEMMSYVGCSEAEMADILRDLGYRVHPPAEPEGPHSFSLVPRRQRDNRNQHRRQERPQGNRPHHERSHGENRGRGQQRPNEAPVVNAEGAPAAAPEQAREGEQRRHERPQRQDRQDRPQQGDKRPNNEQRQARDQKQGDRPPRNEGQRDQRRDDKRGDRRDG